MEVLDISQIMQETFQHNQLEVTASESCSRYQNVLIWKQELKIYNSNLIKSMLKQKYAEIQSKVK